MGNSCTKPNPKSMNIPKRNIVPKDAYLTQSSKSIIRPQMNCGRSEALTNRLMTDEEVCEQAGDRQVEDRHQREMYENGNRDRDDSSDVDEEEKGENRQKPYHNEDIYIG